MKRSFIFSLALVAATAWLVSCSDDRLLEPVPNQPPDASFLAGAQAGEDLIPDQYIVVFKRTVRAPVQLANTLARAHGLTLRHTYQHTIKGFSAVMPEGAVAALQLNPNVSYIEQNRYSYIDNHPKLRQPALLGGAVVMLAKGKPPGSGGGKAPFNPPANLAATATGTSTIDLAWDDSTSDETGFEIERRLGQSGTFTKIDEVGTDVTNYSDGGLADNTEYCYRVRAFKPKNKKGNTYSDYSNIACATTDAVPQNPPDGDATNLVATDVSSSQIDLTWDENATNEGGFEIWRCDDSAANCNENDLGGGPGAYSQIDQTGPFGGAGSYSDMGLGANSTHSYMVRAFNSAGTSSFSNEDDATTQNAPPPPPGCNDNGVHDALTDPGLWGIVKVKADQNGHWLGVRGNDPATCGMRAEFFGLDTGVDSDHPDLNVVEIQCFLAGTPSCTGEDGHGHGSHTAGTAAAIDGGPAGGVVGVAPGAKIHGYKVCTDGGSCPNDDIIAGIDAVTAYKNSNPGTDIVANMSLGGGISDPIDTAVRRSINAGITYTLSAGNGIFGACFFPNDAQLSSPARTGDDDINAGNGSNGDTKRVNGVITTTSSGQNDADVNCNFGNPVTVASPGNGIKSTWLNGGYNTISGTSMAAPHSAGAAILVLQGNPGYTPTQVEQEIVNDLDNWTTNDLPNADGRLDARCLGTTDTSCAGNN